MTEFKQLFPAANTPKGFRSFYSEGLEGIDKVYILKGGPGIGKSTLIRKIASMLQEYNYPCELWQCSSDSSSVDGVICREISLAIIDGTAPHTVDPRYPGVCEKIINLGEFWDESKLRASSQAIIRLFSAISREFEQGYEHMYNASASRRQLLDICSSPYDKSIEKGLFKSIFKASKPHRFFSTAITDKGLICYAESISAASCRRYLLQSRQNDNASKLLHNISAEAASRGLNTEEYYSPFDEEKMELLLIPALSVAIIDQSEPHIKIKRRAEDIDIELLPPLPVSTNEHESEYRNACDAELEKAIACFAKAKEKHDKLESFYTQAMDFDAAGEKCRELIDEIMQLLSNK